MHLPGRIADKVPGPCPEQAINCLAEKSSSSGQITGGSHQHNLGARVGESSPLLPESHTAGIKPAPLAFWQTGHDKHILAQARFRRSWHRWCKIRIPGWGRFDFFRLCPPFPDNFFKFWFAPVDQKNRHAGFRRFMLLDIESKTACFGTSRFTDIVECQRSSSVPMRR